MILTRRHCRSEKVHLICTGALSNAALLLMLYPEVRELLEQIVIMGGCMGVGNTHPVAEFNFQVDAIHDDCSWYSSEYLLPAMLLSTSSFDTTALKRYDRKRITSGILPVDIFAP